MYFSQFLLSVLKRELIPVATVCLFRGGGRALQQPLLGGAPPPNDCACAVRKDHSDMPHHHSKKGGSFPEFPSCAPPKFLAHFLGHVCSVTISCALRASLRMCTTCTLCFFLLCTAELQDDLLPFRLLPFCLHLLFNTFSIMLSE